MKKQLFLICLVLISGCSTGGGEYDEFAQCLSDNGAKMYGASWCPHCNDQKEDFGSSWKYVNYIECALPNGQGQVQICSDEGITGYPTWVFEDGSRLSGRLSFEKLASETECQLS